ncbi:hypothetical protein [Litchfieldella rifensis]|uniref:HAMP domain-containing protein n=1 Tax=Litchfieldella rifensis TaxID=762643 RepID=A0ABV7LLZ5_9GAMM
MGLIWRVVAALCVVNFLALAVFVVIATLQFDAILSGLVRDRVSVLVDGIKPPFESVAELGLPVATVRNAQAVLEEVRQSDSAIIAVQVYGPDGAIVHSTGGGAPTGSITLADPARPGESLHVETGSSFVLSSAFSTATGTPAGGVVVEYSRALSRTQVRAMAASLGVAALAILLATGLATALLTRLALREHVGIVEALLETYDRFERRFWRRGTPYVVQVAPVRGLGLSSAEFDDLLRRSEVAYEAAIGASSDAPSQ